MSTKTKIAAPKGFNTITLYHDATSSPKANRGWKLVLPINQNVTHAVRLPVSDGIAESEGSTLFEEAVEVASKVIRDTFHDEPEWELHPDLGAGVAKWRIA